MVEDTEELAQGHIASNCQSWESNQRPCLFVFLLSNVSDWVNTWGVLERLGDKNIILIGPASESEILSILQFFQFKAAV